MLKGCRKQVIVVYGTGSEIFDKAVFFLKNERDSTANSGTAMLLEANKIIENSRFQSSFDARRQGFNARKSSALFFSLGLIVGAGLILLALLFS